MLLMSTAHPLPNTCTQVVYLPLLGTTSTTSVAWFTTQLLTGQQCCVILSFYSSDPGVSLLPCVSIPLRAFLVTRHVVIPAPSRKHPVGSGHLLLLLTFVEAESEWTHADPIGQTPVSESYRLCQTNTFLMLSWLFPRMSSIALMQIT